MSRAFCRSHLLAIVCLAALAGCADSGLVRVRGKVVFADKTPLTEGNVVFVPADGNPHAAQGAIQADGSFELTTKRPGDGAYPGKYDVAIEAVEPPSDGTTPRPPGQFDRKYENSSTSGIALTVAADSNDFVITVQKPKKK